MKDIEIIDLSLAVDNKILEVKRELEIELMSDFNERLIYLHKEMPVTKEHISSLRSDIKRGKESVPLGLINKLNEIVKNNFRLKEELNFAIETYNQAFFKIQSSNVKNSSLVHAVKKIISNPVSKNALRQNPAISAFTQNDLLESYSKVSDSNLDLPITGILIVFYKMSVSKKTPSKFIILDELEKNVEEISRKIPWLSKSLTNLVSNQKEITISRADAIAVADTVHSNIDLSGFLLKHLDLFEWALIPLSSTNIQISLLGEHNLTVKFI